MKTLTAFNMHYVLEASIEELHKESKEWISETEYWQVELSFFRMTIQKQIPEVTRWEKEQLEKALKLSHSYMFLS